MLEFILIYFSLTCLQNLILYFVQFIFILVRHCLGFMSFTQHHRNNIIALSPSAKQSACGNYQFIFVAMKPVGSCTDSVHACNASDPIVNHNLNIRFIMSLFACMPFSTYIFERNII